jgi:PAS domain S-box-containing protein
MAIGEPAGPVQPVDDARFRRLVETVGVGLFETDERGGVTFASPRWYEMLHIEPQTPSAGDWIGALDDADRPRFEVEWRRATATGSALDVVCRTGGGSHLRIFLTPRIDRSGLLTGFTGAVTDVTEQETRQRELRKSGEQFRQIAEAMPNLVWIAAADGEIEYFNRAWLEYTGSTVKDMRVSGVKGIVHQDDLARTWECWSTALATGEPYEIEYRLRSQSDGSYRWFLARATPVRDDGGSVLRWIGTATDIEAQKQALANLRFAIDAGEALASAQDVSSICRRLAQLAIDLVADWCFVVLVDGHGGYRTAALAHRDASLLRYVDQVRERYPIRPGSPVDTAVRKNVPILLPEITPEMLRAGAEDEEHLRLLERLRMHSALAVPLSFKDERPYGALVLVSSESARRFGQADLEAAAMVAQRAAASIQTAKTIDLERRRSARLRFIARAGELIFESFDLQSTFDSVADLIVSEMADLAFVMRVQDGGTLRTVACAHRDPSKAALTARFRGERTFRPQAEERAIHLLSQHRAVVHEQVTAADLLPGIWEYLAPHVRALGLRSAITVPLFSRGETLGALVAYWCETDASYSQADVPLFEELARRLSIAIDHVTTLERERRIAEALQQALLPSPAMLPHSTGLTFNVQYCPSSREADVGGDWYDAVPLHDGTIVISVGDVTGRGLAAAGLMGKLRQAIGMAALYERDPAKLLDAVDFHLRTRNSSSIATAWVGVIDAERKTLRYANAGHPSPLLRRRGGLIELRSQGLPLGLREESAGYTNEISLEGAELLVLYTDGLTEATRDLAFGEHRLQQIVSSEAILHVRNPARFLCDACLPFAAQDDTAVLTVLFGERTQWSFDADNAQAAHDARRELLDHLRARSGTNPDLSGAELVLGELIGNVVRHAPGPIDVQLQWEGRTPVLHVIDRGKGFVRDPELPGDPLSESGRGLFIVSRLTEGLTVERIPGYGNHVAARLRL